MDHASQLEAEVEQALRKEVERRGGVCLKVLTDYGRGLPDRLVLLPDGIACWVETKRPRGGRLSAAQLVAHERLRRLGQSVQVLRQVEDVGTMLDGLALSAERKEKPLP